LRLNFHKTHNKTNGMEIDNFELSNMNTTQRGLVGDQSLISLQPGRGSMDILVNDDNSMKGALANADTSMINLASERMSMIFDESPVKTGGGLFNYEKVTGLTPSDVVVSDKLITFENT